MKIPKKIHSFFSVFRETDRNFRAETRYVNFNRLRITSPILFVLFLGFAVYDTVSGFGPDLPRRYQNLYLYAHSGAAVLLLIESLFLYIRPARAVDEVRFRHRAASTLFVLADNHGASLLPPFLFQFPEELSSQPDD